jgi:hypothetical protein
MFCGKPLMDTSVLRSFAASARVGLLRDVSARLVGVLAPGSAERVEVPGVVAALEAAISGAGGGDAGRAAVVDRVAYTWFNRIVALRFMDANGFTGVGVVSPQLGQQIGQPEVLADAKSGQLDLEVVSAKGRELIAALLNGSRRSSDAQGEAYGVLLAEYCRHWNRVMPFMFERAGDFTELLIPANLLAPDSLLVKANEVMTAEVCADVEVIGWLYQFYISERKDEVFAGFKKGKKAGAKEIPAATQLFTPDWIVRYLVENSLGRLWLLNNPQSKLADQMDYYIAPVDEETDFLKITSPEELKIMDPACGSGHMLTYAFDLLCAIYEEAGYAPADIPGLILSKNLYGVEIDQRAGSLAAFALAMKARARQRTFFSKDIQPNICVLQNVHFTPDELDDLVTSGGDRFAEEDFWQAFEHADTFGSLIQPDETLLPSLRMHVDHVTKTDQLFTQDVYTRAETVLTQAEYLSQRYHVVVANPPYMGSGNMDSHLNNFAKTCFPNSKSDLFSMFIEQCLWLSRSHGYAAMVTMQSWMFLSSFKSLRLSLLTRCTMTNMAHFGTNAFDTIGGAVVSTAAFVFSRRVSVGNRGTYLRLVSLQSEETKNFELRQAASDKNCPSRFEVRAEEFLSMPGAPISYWLSEKFRGIFENNQRLAEVATTRLGMTTANNELFTRFWWEVSQVKFVSNIQKSTEIASSTRWVPYNKGGRFRKWYGNMETVLDWANDGFAIKHYGEETGAIRSTVPNTSFYFGECATWSKVSGKLAMRYRPPGSIFDVAGACAFTDSTEALYKVLAVANSRIAKLALEALSPSINFEGGQINDLPIPRVFPEEILDENMVPRLIAIAKQDWDLYENSWDFERSPLSADDHRTPIRESYVRLRTIFKAMVTETCLIESKINSALASTFLLADEVDPVIADDEITLQANPKFRYGLTKEIVGTEVNLLRDAISDFVSYAVGCMFGRYSLDETGLVLANQGDTLQEYLAKIPNPSFTPDVDNVIPIVDGDWFEDDIVSKFRQFLRVAFGEENFEENLRFVTETLGVKDLRDYFVKSFYKDHVQRYKKRPIYWLFSSPKGSFNALIYMHRYNPSTVSTVLNEYLREYNAKLSASLQHHERLAVGAGSAKEQAVAAKEVDRLRKVILELDEYEHDVLYPLASQQIAIDLDDGVKANYPKFGTALKKIPGLEASDE